MNIEIKKLGIKPNALNGLPLYFHFIFYNELMDKELESIQYYYDETLECLASYCESEKAISTIIDHTKCIFINKK